jgi:hypothetical protein
MQTKVPKDGSPPFSERVLTPHERIHPSPDGGFPRTGFTTALSVHDQLLVHEHAVDDVAAFLLERHEVEIEPLGTVFQGLGGSTDADDIVVVELRGLPAGTNISDLTDDIRAGVDRIRADERLRWVSPNHVLVPAGFGVGCPAGPPREADDVSLAQAPPGASPTVTVIDSGYQWSNAWGNDPLNTPPFCQLGAVVPAEFIQGTATLAQLQALLNNPGATTGWNQGVPEQPATNGALLPALAGHANFVGGVIAQGCHQPTLNIWTHNSSFVANSDFFPTEAAVCRSIVKSQLDPSAGGTGRTDVIYVGFAFPLRRKNKVRRGLAMDFLSVVWDFTFQRLTHDPLVVAPAGNEATQSRHYPAALDREFPNTHYQNVIGVASLRPNGHKLSNFSNRGDWVKCSTIGEDIVSTFLPVQNVECEEDQPPRPSKNFANGWATWDGTSFAAPKVAAALAARTAAGAAPAAAWVDLETVLGQPASLAGAGTRFQNL